MTPLLCTIRSRNSLAAAVATGLLLVAPASRAEDEGDSALKWTPHRASQPPAVEEPLRSAAEQTAGALSDAAAALVDAVPGGPPASVALPDGVPMIAPATPRQSAGAASRQRRPSPPPPAWSTAQNSRRLYDPTNPDSILGFNILRAPRGGSGRPILAPEGRQAVAMQEAAERRDLGEARYGGGPAPRYQAAGRPPAGARPERLAMNADGIPSVMTRAPQSEALADSRTRGVSNARQTPTVAQQLPPGAEMETIGPGIEMPGSSSGTMPPLGLGDEAPGYPDDFAGPTGPMDEGFEGGMMMDPDYEGGLLMGEYPAQLHVESFYDDPYAFEDEGLFPLWYHDGRICAWLRRFGQPYYGWRWYRDFTASAGITGFTNATDLGINGNFGTNEYLNFALPFWNAFGIGWQVGWRGVQSGFQPATIEAGNRTITKNARTQDFITTGFFTRAFQGRGLQGGIVYDYLHDSWFDNTDVSQLRYELSYVYGYHELGFWGASNIGDQDGLFGPVTRVTGVASTLDLYTGFYRLQFGDANEWKVWGGGTSEADGVIGTLVRAPMNRSLALEGTFTYVIPGRTQTIDFDGDGKGSSFSPAAWNVSVNVVWYPAGRSRRSLASPYRPLFEVADNGSLIRTIEALIP